MDMGSARCGAGRGMMQRVLLAAIIIVTVCAGYSGGWIAGRYSVMRHTTIAIEDPDAVLFGAFYGSCLRLAPRMRICSVDDRYPVMGALYVAMPDEVRRGAQPVLVLSAVSAWAVVNALLCYFIVPQHKHRPSTVRCNCTLMEAFDM